MTAKNNIGEEILELLKSKSEAPYVYINPNFLLEITELVEVYYGLEDDVVDGWLQGMFGA